MDDAPLGRLVELLLRDLYGVERGLVVGLGDDQLSPLAVGIAAYLAKLLILATLLPIGEVTIAKMRVFRYPVFLGGAFAAAALAVFLLFVSRSF